MEEIKVGMIGLDTSHVMAFADILNDPKHAYHVPGSRIVAAYPGGSRDFALSWDRMPKFRDQLVTKYKLKICDSIPELVEQVDAILLESVDGRVHLEQFRRIAPSGKPVFIDKPFTVDLKEALEIERLGSEHACPFFSASSLRFDYNVQKAREDSDPVIGCTAYGPASLEPTQKGIFWYGIHSAEVLFTLMGAGCKAVTCIGNNDTDVVVGRWEDGRIGGIRGIRKGQADFGAKLWREKKIQDVSLCKDPPYYPQLMKAVMGLFRERKLPFETRETLEIIAFLEAANTSKSKGGAEVPIEFA
ncbi:MAG TPA: gfo/Idh/MocA family oxidoreductase [Candidatus Brocadiia bacterium]|nr:gfo/Idh/MocA family oxidoreductase [Candidatus Brocadiia bacterium]